MAKLTLIVLLHVVGTGGAVMVNGLTLKNLSAQEKRSAGAGVAGRDGGVGAERGRGHQQQRNIIHAARVPPRKGHPGSVATLLVLFAVRLAVYKLQVSP